MKQVNFFIGALVFSGLLSFGQNVCRGVLLDNSTMQPIEFANIGIIGKGVGTVTNENGEYNFMVPDSLLNEKIKVSIIGYKPETFSVLDFQKEQKIKLVQNMTVLKEVPVSAKKTKIKIAGNNTQTKRVSGGFKKNNLGAEIGIKIHVKDPQTHLRKVMIHINSNSLDTFPVFRFNVYKTDDKGNPGESMLQENIIITPAQKTGLVEFDLKPYKIFVDEDVIISLEWIKDLGDAKGLYFSTKLVGSTTYFRQASQDKWQKMSPIGVGLHAEIAY